MTAVLSRVAALGVLAVLVTAYVLSWDAMTAVAAAAGIRPTLAPIFPVAVDGLVTVATVSAVLVRDEQLATRAYVGTSLAAALGASVALNALHAGGRGGDLVLSPGVAAVISSTPAVALGLSVHLAVILLRTLRQEPEPVSAPAPRPAVAATASPRRAVSATVPADRAARVRALLADADAEGRPVTGRTLAEALGVSERTARRDLAAVREVAA